MDGDGAPMGQLKLRHEVADDVGIGCVKHKVEDVPWRVGPSALYGNPQLLPRLGDL